MRVQAVDAVLNGQSVDNVAEAFQVDPATVYLWLRRYREAGSNNGLVRRPTSGRPRVLDRVSNNDLLSIMLDSATEYGYETNLWTCVRLAEVIEEQFSVKSSRWTIARRLRDAGMLFHQNGETSGREGRDKLKRWKKSVLPGIVDTFKKLIPVLYFEFDTDVELNSFSKKPSKSNGKKASTPSKARKQGAAMVVTSRSGKFLFNLLNKRVTADQFIQFLEQVLQHHKDRHVVVVTAPTPAHKAKKTLSFVNNQERLHLFFTPDEVPEWNPDDFLWEQIF